MIEILLVLGLGGLLFGALAVLFYVPPMTVFGVGMILTALGLAISLPTGIVYHVALARALGPRGVLPKRWWWSPTSLHVRLLPKERGRVFFWFFLGGAGFVVAIFGLAMVAAGSLRGF